MLIIPIGGKGERFKNAGYTKPKTLINVMGKQIICWLLDNLNLINQTKIVIPYNKELYQYNFENWLFRKYPNLNFIFIKLDKQTDGAVETILEGLKHLNINNYEDESILSIDCDNFYLDDVIGLWNGENSVITFNDISNQNIYSYVSTNANNQIIEIKEKNKISSNACCGCYGFSSWKLLMKYAEKVISNNIRQKNEFYVSSLIQEMINDKHYFINKNIDSSKYVCLGTPFQVQIFCNNYPVHSAITSEKRLKTHRFCFDLDGTLVTFPTIHNDYASVLPIDKNIKHLKYLKKLGHTIIIYTARNMKTHNGNIGKINAHTTKIVFDTLDKYNIPYDEIYFGKPYADFYIDDLAINAYSNIEKELGFYDSKIEPRDFNSIISNSIGTYTKEGKDLSGEIYYYNNIPDDLKDIFPTFINNTGNNSYVMEQIIGIPISKLYLNEQLTITQLNHILNSLHRLHSYKSQSQPTINMYGNYATKLKDRYETYDYSKFEHADKIYNKLLVQLQEYEMNNMGHIGMIHGDPVFTNILINQFEKIKMLDMRGKINNILTTHGDIFYDYAKIYQSLIGYDEILFDKQISEKYKSNMINAFNNYIINLYDEKTLNNIRLITKSLFFSLIPIHDNNKCYEYIKHSH